MDNFHLVGLLTYELSKEVYGHIFLTNRVSGKLTKISMLTKSEWP
jgi:hypothetical protein